MLTIVIANRNYSSWSLRGWLMLAQTGAPFEEVLIPFEDVSPTPAIVARVPSGLVPALEDGDVRVWESLAIGEYLAELFPDAGLWPADRAARATARAVSAEMHAGFAALRQAMPMNMRARGGRGRERTAEVDADIARIQAIWRDCRERFGGHGAGPFLFGGFGIADAMYAPVVSRFLTYGVVVDRVAEDYLAAVWAHPPMQRWVEAAAAETWAIDRYDSVL